MRPVAIQSGIQERAAAVRRVVVRDGARPAARLGVTLALLVAFDLALAAVVWWGLLRGSP